MYDRMCHDLNTIQVSIIWVFLRVVGLEQQTANRRTYHIIHILHRASATSPMCIPWSWCEWSIDRELR